MKIKFPIKMKNDFIVKYINQQKAVFPIMMINKKKQIYIKGFSSDKLKKIKHHVL